jgi:hypothetical protein
MIRRAKLAFLKSLFIILVFMLKQKMPFIVDLE